MSIFSTKSNPIGIDFGRASLKMVQMKSGGQEVIADKREVPAEARRDPVAYYQWGTKAIKDMLTKKPFKGHIVRSSLSAGQVEICHLRLDKMSQDELKKIIQFEIREKVSFDTENAMIRHIVAGEVFDSKENSTKLEVIVLVVSNKNLFYHIKCLENAKLEIDNVSVPAVILPEVYKNAGFQNQDRVMFVDIGYESAWAVISKGENVTFCRNIQSAFDKNDKTTLNSQVLLEELKACLRYHDMIWEKEPVTKILFTGGYAGNNQLVNEFANRLGLEISSCHLPVDFENGLLPDSQWSIAYGVTQL